MQKSYALFDFDGTLLKGDSIVRFCTFAWKKKLCPTRTLLHGGVMAIAYALKLATAERSKEACLHFLVGKSEKEIAKLSLAFCRQILAPRLYSQGKDEIAMHKAAGREVLLITASPSFYLEPMKKILGISDIIGTRMDIDMDGRHTGLICGENCRGLQKPLRLAEYLAAKGDRLHYEDSYAYGDTSGDIPMMMLCANHVAVNPRRKLRASLGEFPNIKTVRWGAAKRK